MAVSAGRQKDTTVASEPTSGDTADTEHGVLAGPIEGDAALQTSQIGDDAGHALNNLLARVICLAEEIQEATDLPAVHDRAETLIITVEGGARLVRQLMASTHGPFVGNEDHAPGAIRRPR